MRNGFLRLCVALCFTLAGMSAFAQDPSTELRAGGNVAFRVLTPDETGIRAIMDKWYDAELARQGGKFGSHGWWLWGLTAFDYDGDGDMDLLPTHHGGSGGLILKSLLTESGKLTFVDVTTELGITSRDLPIADGKPWVWDFDGDGWLDIAGWSDESKPASFFNLGGKRFEKIPNFTFNPISHAGEVLDLNDDGYLDVRAEQRGTLWECLYDPKARTFVKHNRGPVKHDGVPEDVLAFFAELKKEKKNRFFSVSFSKEHDLNGDGRSDLVAAGSAAYGGSILGRYYLAGADGKYVDRTKELGLPEEGCPILITDLTGDGLDDIVVAVGDGAGLYVNSGKGGFTRAANSLVAFLKKGGPYLLRAFPVDFDDDGDMDLVVSNPRYGAEEVHENLGSGNFRLVLKTRGWDSDPIAICDIDGDGRIDLVIGGPGSKKPSDITLFLNVSKNPGNFCNISPRMDKPNWAAVGTVLEVYRAGELGRAGAKPLLVEKAHPDATPVHVGLGAATTFDLRVTFPGKQPLELKNVTAAKNLTVTPDGLVPVENRQP